MFPLGAIDIFPIAPLNVHWMFRRGVDKESPDLDVRVGHFEQKNKRIDFFFILLHVQEWNIKRKHSSAEDENNFAIISLTHVIAGSHIILATFIARIWAQI